MSTLEDGRLCLGTSLRKSDREDGHGTCLRRTGAPFQGVCVSRRTVASKKFCGLSGSSFPKEDGDEQERQQKEDRPSLYVLDKYRHALLGRTRRRQALDAPSAGLIQEG